MQVLHDGLPSPRFWVCCRIDLPRVWGDVFRTSELLCTGLCGIFNDNSVICKSCVLFCIEVYIVLQRLYGVTSNPNDCDFLLQVFGIIFTICQGKIMDSFNTLAGNLFLCAFLLIGTIITGADHSVLIYLSICSSLIEYRAHTWGIVKLLFIIYSDHTLGLVTFECFASWWW